MKKAYDGKADAAYFYLTSSAGVVAETTELSDSILVDYDASGRPIGIEVLNATDVLPEKVLSYLKRDLRVAVK